MSDHIPDTGKMVPDTWMEAANRVLVPGKPMTTSDLRKALAAVAPLIAAAERERCARVAERLADSWAADWRAGIKANSHLEGKSDGGDEIAAAIRALGDKA